MTNADLGGTPTVDFKFTKLQVHDLDKSTAFYASAFGFVEMARVEATITGRSVTEVVYTPTAPGGPVFILAKFHDSTSPADAELVLGMSTNDIDALLAKVEEAGGRVLERQDSTPQSPYITAFIHDPEGHLLQINQPVS